MSWGCRSTTGATTPGIGEGDEGARLQRGRGRRRFGGRRGRRGRLRGGGSGLGPGLFVRASLLFGDPHLFGLLLLLEPPQLFLLPLLLFGLRLAPRLFLRLLERGGIDGLPLGRGLGLDLLLGFLGGLGRGLRLLLLERLQLVFELLDPGLGGQRPRRSGSRARRWAAGAPDACGRITRK